MAKKESQLVATKPEEQLLSKQAIALPPKERLQLLLSASYYPVVKKGTSAEVQIKEMLDFYNLCLLMLIKFFQDEDAESNYLLLKTLDMTEQQSANNLPASKRWLEAFKLLKTYKEFERKITAIKELFCKYSKVFPEIYEKYKLEEIVSGEISDMLEGTKYMLKNCTSAEARILERWGLL